MRARLRTLLFILLIFSPALFTANLIRENAVDVAAWDEWETSTILAKWHDGTLTWGDLYAPQIQHRMVIPRLLTILMANLSGGDFRWNVYACLAATLLNALLLWKLVQRSMGHSPWRWPLMFAINLFLFCPMHYETLQWGSSMWGDLPLPCFLGALLILTPQTQALDEPLSPRSSWLRYAGALVLTQIATHSFAHGLAIWPVLFMLIMANPTLGTLRTRLIQGGLWIVITGLTVWAYFTNFINVAFHAYNLKPGDHAMKGAANLLEGDNLAKAMEFVFGFFGSWFARTPFVEHPLDRAIALGIIGIVIYAVLFGFALTFRGVRAKWQSLLPWLTLSVYIVTVGLLLSKRAGDMGVHRAVLTRYLAISEQFYISGLMLAALVGGALITSLIALLRKAKLVATTSEAPPHLRPLLGAILLVVLCMAQLPLWQYGLHLTEAAHRGRRHARALMVLLPHLRDQKRLISMKPLCKSFDYCQNAINELRRIGLLHTATLETPELKWFRQESKPLSTERADITEARFDADGNITFDGIARFGADSPADLVLVVQSGRIIGIGQPSPKHILRIFALDFDMTNIQEVTSGSMYPWHGVISPALIPNPTALLEFWALDIQGRRVARIGKTITVDPTAKQVSVKAL